MNTKSLSLAALEEEYEQYRARGLQLDLTRGKPSAAQLDLSDSLDGILDGNFIASDGSDTRNYGGLHGIPEMRQLGADLLGTRPEQVICFGSASLTLMYLYMQLGHLFGFGDADSAWQRSGAGPVRFLCPVPGYDRHFTVCEQLGIEMINVPMTDTGPDMDMIEAAVKKDPRIKGIWCVPVFSNPTGITFSNDVVERLAKLPGLAGDHFRVMWDNAYAAHDFRSGGPEPLDIMPVAEAAGTADGIAHFASASKVTHAGAGVAFAAMTEGNLARFVEFLGVLAVGPDKVNQLRHARMFPDMDALRTHMVGHAKVVGPKFAITEDILKRDLGNLDIAHWNDPRGGYFVSLDVAPGLATETVRLAGEVGVRLTPAGATFPYRKDPQDRNIRVAPTLPNEKDLTTAMEVLTLCVRLAWKRQHPDAG